MLPTTAVRVFELCVAVDRNQSYQSAVLKGFMRDNEFKIKGSLMEHPDVEGSYVVGLHPTSNGRVLTADRSIKPEPRTRVRMFIKAPSDGAQNYYRFHGIVIEDLFGTRAELTLLVEGPELDFDYGIPPPGFEKNEYLVAVECVDDPTPSLRWKPSIHVLNWGQQCRTKGLDVKHLVLQSQSTMTDTGSMANEMAANSDCNDLVRVVAMERKLGTMQTKAVEVACTTKTGLATIQGPPGTGKSETLAAIGEVQHAIGNAIGVRRCSLGVASSNFALGELVKKFVNSKHRKGKMEIVIYKGSQAGNQKQYKKREKTKCSLLVKADDSNFELPPRMGEDRATFEDRFEAENLKRRTRRLDQDAKEKEMRELEEKLRPLWQLADEIRSKGADPLDEYAIHMRRLAAFKRWAKTRRHDNAEANPGKMDVDAAAANDMAETLNSTSETWQLSPPHPKAHEASRFLSLRQEVAAAQKKKPANRDEKEARAKIVAELTELDEECSGYYLRNEVDMVFCTNSMSASGILPKYYRPRFILQDEAALANIPDAATPLAAFIEWLELLVQACDHKQHSPMISSLGFNELADLLLTSLFELALVSDLYKETFVMLDLQYRMHPRLAEFPNTQFYNGKILNNPGMDKESRRWVTLRDFTHKSKTYNGRRRLAIDCSEGYSFLPEGSTSHANHFEADAMMSFIHGAVNHPPPEGGEALVLADFLVLTFYQSQLRLLVKKARGLNIPAGSSAGSESTGVRLQMLSTRVVQGGEGRFVLLAFTKNILNHPMSLGFLADPRGLCVALTRAQEALVLFGNFGGWVENLRQGHTAFIYKGGNAHALGCLVKSLWEKRDIVGNEFLE
jgi:hypothetical protein